MDDDMLRRMSNRKYLSMSIEHQYNLPADGTVFLQSESSTGSDFSQEVAMGLKTFTFLYDYVTLPCQMLEPYQPWPSAFQAGTPGVMRLEDVEQAVDLGRWKLKLRGMVIFLQVRRPETPTLRKQLG
jgi:hypothetical protein